MEAILFVLLTTSGDITSQRVASIEECNVIAKSFPHLGSGAKAWCIPVKPLEIVTPEQVLSERKL